MKFFAARLFKKNEPNKPISILLPVEAIGALKFENVSTYTLILKKSWELSVPYEVDRIEATIQKGDFQKLGIEVL